MRGLLFPIGVVAAIVLALGLIGCSDSADVGVASSGAGSASAGGGSRQAGGSADGSGGDNGPAGVDGSAGSGSTDSGGGSGQSDGSSSASRNKVPFAPKPADDRFYRPPDSVPDKPRGTILKSRMVTFAPEGGVPMPNDAWQLKFISRDVNGNPIAAIATVVKPQTEPPGSSPLLAYQYAEDSLGIKCAPSHSVTGSTQNGTSQAEAASPIPGLEQGWTLVYPDHEGPDSAYAAGRIAGQITLDSIRAAEHFKPLGLSAQTRVGMWGYSGGAIATAWAATLQKAYAPGLNIVAIASGGTPADLIGIARNADTNPITNAGAFSLVLSAIEGVNRAYPKLITSLLNDKGRAAFKSLANGCDGNTSDGSSKPTGHFSDYVTVDNPFDQPQVKAVAPEIDLPQPESSPVADTFVYQSQLDEIVPVAGVNALVKDWCRKGATIHYYKGDTGEHITFEANSLELVLAYLSSRFDLQTAVVPPTTQTCN